MYGHRFALAILLCAAAASPAMAQEVNPAFTTLVANPDRAAANSARVRYRHPCLLYTSDAADE